MLHISCHTQQRDPMLCYTIPKESSLKKDCTMALHSQGPFRLPPASGHRGNLNCLSLIAQIEIPLSQRAYSQALQSQESAPCSNLSLLAPPPILPPPPCTCYEAKASCPDNAHPQAHSHLKHAMTLCFLQSIHVPSKFKLRRSPRLCPSGHRRPQQVLAF